jgi:hypothetical protein
MFERPRRMSQPRRRHSAWLALVKYGLWIIAYVSFGRLPKDLPSSAGRSLGASNCGRQGRVAYLANSRFGPLRVARSSQRSLRPREGWTTRVAEQWPKGRSWTSTRVGERSNTVGHFGIFVAPWSLGGHFGICRTPRPRPLRPCLPSVTGRRRGLALGAHRHRSRER